MKKETWKKVAAIGAAAVLCLSLFACSSSKSDDQAKKDTEEKSRQHRTLQRKTASIKSRLIPTGASRILTATMNRRLKSKSQAG